MERWKILHSAKDLTQRKERETRSADVREYAISAIGARLAGCEEKRSRGDDGSQFSRKRS